jgi:predicted ABC-type ATPase
VTKPYLVIPAGPNGVGKTTFARANLPDFVRSDAFLNADDFARDMRPEDVAAVAVRAGRRLVDERQVRLKRGQSFCMRQRSRHERFFELSNVHKMLDFEHG